MASDMASNIELDRRQERRERNLRFLQEQIQKDLEEESVLKGESTYQKSIDSGHIKVRHADLEDWKCMKRK
jgi:hypothetical protein